MTDREFIKKFEQICLSAMSEIGLTIGQYKIGIRKNMKTLGLCYEPIEEDPYYRIYINRKLFDKDLDKSILLGVMGHEMLHACTPCDDFMDHTPVFMEYAQKLSQRGIYVNMSWDFEFPNKGEGEYLCSKCECGEVIQYKKIRIGRAVQCPVCGKIYTINDKNIHNDNKELNHYEYKRSELV